MKLSRLKALIERIEAARVDGNQDPDVQFWILRADAVKPPGEKESGQFIELGLQETHELEAHRVPANTWATRAVQQAGDFSIPLAILPAFK